MAAPGFAVTIRKIRIVSNAEFKLDHRLPFARADVGTVTLVVARWHCLLYGSVPRIGTERLRRHDRPVIIGCVGENCHKDDEN